MAVINGTVGNDFLNGTATDDTIFGFEGADDLLGNDGNDFLVGGTGAVLLSGFNDFLNGGNGNDTLDAGDGPDSLFGEAGNDLLLGGAGIDTLFGGFDADTLRGGLDDDQLFGEDGNDLLDGEDGIDVLSGGAGNDTILGGVGNETLDGGTGRDTADYSALGGGTTLRAQGVVDKGGLGTDQIIGIERIVGNAAFFNVVDGLVGPGQTTRLVADFSANFLLITGIPFLGSATFTFENFGGFRGGFNDDIGIGSDTFSEIFFGSAGNDFYDGRGNFDTIDYNGLGARVTLLAQGQIVKDGLGIDQIANMESINGDAGFRNLIDGLVAGPQTTSFNVDLGSALLQVLGIPGLGIATFTVVNFVDVRGTQNSDTIVGSAAVNDFFGTRGDDRYDGRDGFDTIDYSGLGVGVTLRSQGVIDKGSLGTDQISNMEKIVGAAGLDPLGITNAIDGTVAGPQVTAFFVDLAANFLQVQNIPGIGFANFEVIDFNTVTGTQNNDVILGDAQERNFFFGSLGFDFYDGRDGFDQITYSGLGPITLRATGIVDKGAAGIDTIAAFERISGEAGLANLIDAFSPGPQPTRVFVDLEALNLQVFDIPGAGSNPTLFFVDNFPNVRGTTNGDTINGDALDNMFLGGEGNDLYDGRGGVDTIDYALLGGPVTLLSQGAIAKGALGTDTISNMERIVGAAGFSNRIDGTVANPAAQTTSFNINLAANSLVINGIPILGSASFQVFNFPSVVGTNNADIVVGDVLANTLSGAGGNDTLRGGDGNDSLVGGTGADSMDGGAGLDTAGYAEALAGVVANLAAPGGNTGIAAGDTYLAVENLSGSAFADALTGNGANNRLTGEDGNDTLLGLLGFDTLLGGAGDDSAAGDTGNDSLNGGAGNDQLGGDASNDTLVGDFGNDTLEGGDGNDSVAGGADLDVMRGGIGNDTLLGQAGNDTLTGGAGNDRLTGGLNSDVFVFLASNEGIDTITDFNPVAGQDSFQVSRAGFGGVLPLGALPAVNFAGNLTAAPTAAAPQILYDTDGGQLFFDIDGTGAAARTQLALLQGLPAISAANFTVIA